MSEDYKNGFKDGFIVGLEEGKKQSLNSMKSWNETKKYDINHSSIHETCPKCAVKINQPMGCICNSPNCPIFAQFTCNSTGI